MKITAALAAQLRLLTQALDVPEADITESLIRLTGDARAAVSSYLGLCVRIVDGGSQYELPVLEDGLSDARVRTSLRVPLSPATIDEITTTAQVALILYAATPGAFVDLAADLAWLTGRHSSEFGIDEHQDLPFAASEPDSLSDMSTVNQAIGVLIGRGSTPEQAERELREPVAKAGGDLLAAATLVLQALRPTPRPDDP